VTVKVVAGEAPEVTRELQSTTNVYTSELHCPGTQIRTMTLCEYGGVTTYVHTG